MGWHETKMMSEEPVPDYTKGGTIDGIATISTDYNQYVTTVQTFRPVNQIIDEVLAYAIPLYTNKNPNPTTGKPDCQIMRACKQGLRLSMTKKLNDLIAEYERKVKAGE